MNQNVQIVKDDDGNPFESDYASARSETDGGFVHPSHRDLPYIESIKALEKIQQFTSPREKLVCVAESFSTLKTAVVDFWKGKIELSQMDDVLPLVIYLVSEADMTHPCTEFDLLEDYLKFNDKGFELERKLLTNLSVSVQYINHEWEL